MNLLIGVAADDFTGASDIASFLKEGGLNTVLINGIPNKKLPISDDTNAIVIAMKTRTVKKEEAIDYTLKAFDYLKSLGAKNLYYKYCATFDSTKEGNIGPVCDAVLEKYNLKYTILCPALPINGRTVKDGLLYVNNVLLENSHMKDHPLTPMHDSKVSRLMEMQSKYKAYDVNIRDIKDNKVKEYSDKHYYLIPEYFEDNHNEYISNTFSKLNFFTGGSGLAKALAKRLAMEYNIRTNDNEKVDITRNEKTFLLAGSCSKVTLEQIQDYKEKGNPALFVLPSDLYEKKINEKDLVSWLEENDRGLIYTSQSPNEIKKTQKLGQEEIATLIEETLSNVSKKAVDKGFYNIISAGGETSGAVTKALGYDAFYIGKSVAPGVPIMIPVENTNIRLVLKSGGFGQKDFFDRAVNLTEE